MKWSLMTSGFGAGFFFFLTVATAGAGCKK